MDDAWFDELDGLGLAAAIRGGDVTAAEALEAAIRPLEERNRAVNAVVATRFEEARAEAAAGLPDGPFRGVPYLVKSLGARSPGADLAGLTPVRPATSQPPTASPWRGRGLPGWSCSGMTNTPELGKNGSTEPVVPRPDPQPVRPEPVAGRIQRRLGGRGRVGHGADRARQRRRRLDPHPGARRAGCSG